ncbi:hypothetical protein GF362_05780 [Candidatus Dojkabacteria bacterium]|nr:hypothetical protein [Candidatus Dojkabacteria bacterium]
MERLTFPPLSILPSEAAIILDPERGTTVFDLCLQELRAKQEICNQTGKWPEVLPLQTAIEDYRTPAQQRATTTDMLVFNGVP